jgi:hypothetical protein
MMKSSLFRMPFDLLSLLRREFRDVYIPDEAEGETLRQLVKDGPNHLSMVGGFDRVLTVGYNDAGEHMSTWDLVSESSSLGSRVSDYSQRMIKVTRNVSRTAYYDGTERNCRSRSFRRLFDERAGLVGQSGHTAYGLRRCVELSSLRLRPGCLEMLTLCEAHGIPFRVITSGILDVARMMFPPDGKDLCEWLGNELKYSSRGMVSGFYGDMCTPLSKHGLGDGVRLGLRKNVIMLGHTMDEVDMVNRLTEGNPGKILKIMLVKESNSLIDPVEIGGYDMAVTDSGGMSLITWILMKTIYHI